VVPGPGNSDREDEDDDEDQPERFHSLNGTLRSCPLCGSPRSQLVNATHAKILCHDAAEIAYFRASELARGPFWEIFKLQRSYGDPDQPQHLDLES